MAYVLCAMAAAAAASMSFVIEGPESAIQPAPEIEISLISIRELRVLDLEEPAPADEDEMFFVMSGEQPSLVLEWRIALPDGSRLVEVVGLRDLEARDSTGRELAPEDLEAALSADPRYEFGDFGEEPQEILDTLTLTLLVPDRKAETLSLSAEADATFSTGTQEVKIDLTDQWQTVAADRFGGEPVRIRLNHDMGEIIGVEFSPAAAAERAVESLRLNFEGNELDDSGSMNDYSTITYFFDGALERGQPASLTMTVRTGLQTIPIRLDLKDQKLP